MAGRVVSLFDATLYTITWYSITSIGTAHTFPRLCKIRVHTGAAYCIANCSLSGEHWVLEAV
jgi:hypothetical protein